MKNPKKNLGIMNFSLSPKLDLCCFEKLWFSRIRVLNFTLRVWELVDFWGKREIELKFRFCFNRHGRLLSRFSGSLKYCMRLRKILKHDLEILESRREIKIFFLVILILRNETKLFKSEAKVLARL